LMRQCLTWSPVRGSQFATGVSQMSASAPPVFADRRAVKKLVAESGVSWYARHCRW
jgi:hypothetical protein